ncbi:MAG: NAD(P)H-hydrate dehydratase [Pedobacter sp.]|nr:NAD(P)H-hydrate dehydratase [Pedobacter sp.]
MNNLLTAEQMRDQRISSIYLMEKAAHAFVDVFRELYHDRSQSISILCGQGNNGGDGLAIARLLYINGFENISVYLVNFGTNESPDRTKNVKRLAEEQIIPIFITAPSQFENIETDLIIDAVLGSGLNKPFTGKYAALANKVNSLGKRIIAVDVPTGFPSEGAIVKNYKGIRADLVICFQRPKLNFFFPESVVALNQFKVVDIGLEENFILAQPSDWKLITKPTIKTRKNFTHKGIYGHALIVAGNSTTMGAALLAGRACLHTGAGLTTLCLPQSGLIALNATLPEVMALPRNEQLSAKDFAKFTAIAIGPGLGLEVENEVILAQLIVLKKPFVIDADSLTILSKRRDLLDKLPEQTILTPHLKEFDRIFGKHQTWWERVATAIKQAKARRLIIVLKNQYTFVCLPNGEVHINQTGNSGMASGGMGDVLTGIIVGFLAQSYSPADAAKLAVYLHGKAGDELTKKRSIVSASQVADRIPKAIKKMVD